MDEIITKNYWKSTSDYQRYKDEHAEFLRLFKLLYPDHDIATRIFWRLDKLKIRYPDIAKKMESFRSEWYKKRGIDDEFAD